MTRKTPQNLLQGQAGVYQVASQLCLRGFNPHFPAVDIGADLVIDGGIRIQVKASNLRVDKVYKRGAYWFKLGRTAIRNRKQVWEAVTFTDFCDFAVFWGIDQNRFWIVPAPELDGHQCLTVGPDLGYRDVDVDRIIEMKEAGKLQQEIATELGTTQITVSRRLRGIHTEPKYTLAYRVRKCENRWDLIQSYLDLISGVNSSTSSVGPPIFSTKED